MSDIEQVVRNEILAAGIRAGVVQEVVDLLETEIARSKDCGDLQTAETYELIAAKVKAKISR